MTHRAVAAEAGVPLASTTYYFASKQDLLLETLREHLARDGGEMSTPLEDVVAAATPDEAADRLADLLAGGLLARSDEIAAEYELALEARRHEAMRELSESFHDEVSERFQKIIANVGSSNPSEDTYIILMVMAGLEIDTLTRPSKGPSPERTRAILKRLLGALLKTPGSGA